MHRIGMLAGLAFLSGASVAAAQTSKYIVAAGIQRTISVLQNHAIDHQWSEPADEYVLAIPPGIEEVRTTGYLPSLPGRTYDFDGNVIGGVLRHDIPGECYDSTSDGTHNYLINFLTGDVYSTDLDFQNEVLIFNVSKQQFGTTIGIAYDSLTETLWFSAWGNEQVSNFTLDGEFIFRFFSGHLENTALAFDPADGTLWLYDHSLLNGTYEQWHTSGVRLFRGVIPGMENNGVYGGEFALCYPDFDGSGDLNLFDFLGFTNAFNGQDARADCDGDGLFDLFDFLCFTNAFNAGC